MIIKNLPRMRFALFVACLVSLLSGCSTNPVHQTTKKDPADPSSLPELKKVYMPSELARNINVVSVNQETVNGDLIQIQVNLENLTKKPMNLNYKVEWMDEAGIVINDSSARLAASLRPWSRERSRAIGCIHPTGQELLAQVAESQVTLSNTMKTTFLRIPFYWPFAYFSRAVNADPSGEKPMRDTSRTVAKRGW